MSHHDVFVTGATGYVGTRLSALLTARGHAVRGLVRAGSERKLPAGTTAVIGNALDATTFADKIPPSDTLVHLVGTPHPGPAKAAEFLAVDLPSIRASVTASIGTAKASSVRHIIYVSVAHPAPVMGAYIAVRKQGEEMIRESGIPATILRPWYVLGPGHRWPYLLLPFYALSGFVPAWRESGQRLGLVTLPQMVAALVQAVENPPGGIRIVDVPGIRAAGESRG